MQQLLYSLPYNIYILLFGVYVSMRIACGSFTIRQWRLFSMLCPIFLLLQGVVISIRSAETVRLLYPLLTHLPLVLSLILIEKRRWSIALISVSISYSFCQLPRWIGLLLSLFHLMPAAFVFIHIALSHLMLMLLDRFCLTAIHSVIHLSPILLFSFSVLPVLYYLFEYFLLYTNKSYSELSLFSELMPTAMIFFFVLFVILYRQEAERRIQAEQRAQILQMELTQADQEMKVLRVIEEQTAIFRHDLRHHLTMIDSLLSCDNQNSVQQYIREAKQHIDSIVPARLCANETVNLLLCAFKEKADAHKINLSVKANLPDELPLSDTELCAILSNGLENAIHAAECLIDHTKKTIDILFCIRQDNLLLEIKNPYQGELRIEGGLPVSQSPGVHYGCRSIQSIALRRHGMCTFSSNDGLFTLRVVIPTKQPNLPHRL